MKILSIPYFLPLLFIAVLMGILGFTALKRKKVEGAVEFAVMVFAVMVWAILSMVILLNISDTATCFFIKLKYNVIILVPLTWIYFIFRYTGLKNKLKPYIIVLILIIPLMSCLLIWHNSTLVFIWKIFEFRRENGLLYVHYEFGVLLWVLFIYSYLLLVCGVVLLIKRIVKLPSKLRISNILLLVSMMLPWISHTVHIFFFSTNYAVPDHALFSFAITAFLVIIGLLNHWFLDIAPAAREAVFNNIRDLVFILDENNYIIDFNPAAKVFLKNKKLLVGGCDAAEALPFLENIADLFDAEKCIFRAIELEMNNEKRYFDIRISPITDKDYDFKGSMIFLYDITERKLAEFRETDERDKRIEQRQMLIQQSKLASMGEMMGAIAHQWRQPLNALGLLIQDIEDAHKFGELDDSYIKETVEKGMAQVNFLSDTIDDFRNFFKISKQKIVFDVKSTINEILSIISAQFKTHNILVNVEYHIKGKSGMLFGHRVADNVAQISDEREFTISVFGFPNEFKQVILNIVNNSRDAILSRMDENEIQEEKYFIHFDISQQNGMTIIAISDNGGGIPEDIIRRIFEPYYSTKDEGKGTGIGLYMSKVIIEKNMGGCLYCENTEIGAKFVIELNSATHRDSKD